MESITLEDKMREAWSTLTLSQKQSVVQLINSFKTVEVEWSEEEITAYNMDIEEAEKQILQHDFVTHEEVIKSLEKWK